MKFTKYLGITLVILMASSCSNSINGLFNETKKGDNYFALTVPKWVMKTADKELFVDHLGTDENTDNLLTNIKKARVLVQNEKQNLDMDKIRSIFNKITDKKNYDEYMTIRKDGKVTSIVVNESKNKVKDILLFTESDDSLVLLHLESDISLERFTESDFFKEI